MRRTPASSSQLGVSLFPFLAVLLCTMGALIVVLIVVTRRAHAQALAQAEPHADDQAALELLEFRVDAMRQQREATQQDLAQKRFVLGQIEDHWRQLESKLIELRAADAQFDQANALDDTQRAEVERQLAQLSRQIAQTEQRLAETQRDAAGKPPKFAVVPYDGPSGTRRRPIYIECRDTTVLLQPEGVALGVQDFSGPLGPSNPLASGVRAIREYLAAQQRDLPQGQEPYPLLLVRPDGVEAYYVARMALQDWDTEFGYEMIEADWELEFPPPDEQLRQIVEQAIDDARVRQKLLAQYAPRHRAEPRARSYRAAPGGGGIVPDGGGPPSVASSSRNARGGGWSSGGNGWGLTGRAGSGISRDDTPGGGDGDLDVGDLPYGAPAGSAGLAGGTAGGGSSEFGGNGLRGDSLSGSGAGGGAADGNSLRAGQGGKSSGTSNTGSTTPSSADRMASTGGASDANRPWSGATSRAAGQPGARSSTGSSSAGSASTAASAASGTPGSMGPADPNNISAGMANIDFSQSSQAQSLADSRGKDWGVPESLRHATAVSRPLRVECRADRLTISDPGGGKPRVIELPGDTEASIDPLVGAVWEQVQTWGIAGQGMYWHPVLSCDVMPDGQARFADLQKLLEGSGLEVKWRGAGRAAVRRPALPRR